MVGGVSALTGILPRLDSLSIDAIKRRANAGHYGLVDNSASPIRLVVLSRLMRSQDDSTLAAVAISPTGLALLAALRGTTLRVAIASGRADSAFNESQVETFFNSPASTIHTSRLYAQQLSLPSKLPQPQAKEVLAALLSAVGAARATPAGTRLVELMLTPTPPSDASASLDMLVAGVEQRMVAELGESGPSGSSESSAPPIQPPPAEPQPSTPPPPIQPPPPLPPMPVAVPSDVLAMDPDASLAATFARHLAARWSRQLSPAEIDLIYTAMDDGLAVMQPDDANARRQLLDGDVLVSLSNTAAAQLWACCLEVAKRGLASASEVADAIVSACGAVSTLVFPDAVWL
jgi:hypothetical protein